MNKKNPFELDVVSIRLVKEAPLLSTHRIKKPEDAVQVLGDMLCDMDREVGCVINLASDKSPINCSIVSMGILNAAMMHPREILKSSILSNAESIILLHNHPSGNLEPSRQDILLTDKMLMVCTLMEIPLLDHIIIGRNTEKYFSFREKSMISVPKIEYKTSIEKLNFNEKNNSNVNDFTNVYINERSLELDTVINKENNREITHGNDARFNIELRDMKEALGMFGWEFQEANGEHTYWYTVEPDTGEIIEKDFNNLEELQHHLEQILHQRELQKELKTEIKYFVAECMEFTNLGAIYDNIPTIEEAIKIYNGLPEERRNMGNGIGAIIDGAEYPLLQNGMVDAIEYYGEDIKNNQEIIHAVQEIKEYLSLRNEKKQTLSNGNAQIKHPHREENMEKTVEPNEKKGIIGKEPSNLQGISNDINKEKQNNMTTVVNQELSPQEEKKQQLLQQLEEGIKSTLDSDTFAKWCTAQSKLFYNKYSLNNAILAFYQKPEASYLQSYDRWQQDGRQVKKGAVGIKILAPVFIKDYGEKGSFFASVRKHCSEQLRKNPNLEYASYPVPAANLEFIMYKNGLFDVKINNQVKMAHITVDETRKFIDNCILEKVPRTYRVTNVFDISDTKDVDYVWLKSGFKKEELALDDRGKPIRNQKGQYKVINTDERKATFDVKLDMTIQPSDTKKMEILYDVLKKISHDKGVPVSEISPEKDEHIAGGALGYYSRNGNNIVLNEELDVTNKVAVLLHEMTHSDLHKDLKALKEEIREESNEDIKITRQLKEMQAEAVAYSVGRAFGLETDHKSFGYIAHWSEGRELKSLQQSLNVIYKECGKLMSSIEKELSERGLNMQLEQQSKDVILEEDIHQLVADYKKFVLDESRNNESMQKGAFSELKMMQNEEQQVIIKEQIVLMAKVEETLNTMNQNIEILEKATNLDEQENLKIQIESSMARVMMEKDKIENLSVERINVIRDIEKQEKKDIQSLYLLEPMKLMQQLQNDFPQLQELSQNDLKYISTSPYVRVNYGKFLGQENEKWVAGALSQLNNFKQVLSKNSTAVEITYCETWTEQPIFEDGAVMHPKMANTIVKQAEEQIQVFKKDAEEKGAYFPYSKCKFSVFTLDNDKNLISIASQIDIGSGSQKDFMSCMKQVCEISAPYEPLFNEQQVAQFSTIYENCAKACRERTNIQMLTPAQAVPVHVQKLSSFDGKSMDEWKRDIKSHMDEKTKSESLENVQSNEIGLSQEEIQEIDIPSPIQENELERG